MNSKERVLSAFAFEEPDRVPMWCGASDEFWAKAKRELNLDDQALSERFHDDFRRVQPEYVAPSSNDTPPELFGIGRAGIGYGQATSHPLANATLNEILDYPWPNPDWMDVSSARANAQQYGGQYAILGGSWAPFWHDMIDLLGMENMYLKMYDSPELIDALLGKIVDFYLEVSRRMFDVAGEEIDIFFFGNDFGSQRGPLLSEPMFRRFILPHIERLVRLGHDYKLNVMMHCCGAVSELIPALIEVELDGLHALQPCCEAMQADRLKRDFGDKILFNGAIDSHHTLIDGTPEEVREKTAEILKVMMPGGGYVASASHDTILEETPTENVLAMFDAVCEFGTYCKGK